MLSKVMYLFQKPNRTSEYSISAKCHIKVGHHHSKQNLDKERLMPKGQDDIFYDLT
jgi:hypothetical protein